MDIVVYIDEKFCENGNYKFTRLPRNININDVLWFATDGAVRCGYKINEIDESNPIVYWNTNSFVKPNPFDIETKPFKGFKYRWW